MTTEQQIIIALRSTLKRHGVKLTDLSVAVDVPYRTLQNWFSEGGSMPLSAYIAICNHLRLSGAFGELCSLIEIEDQIDRDIVAAISSLDHLEQSIEDDGISLRYARDNMLRLIQIISQLRITLRRAS